MSKKVILAQEVLMELIYNEQSLTSDVTISFGGVIFIGFLKVGRAKDPGIYQR